MVSIEIVDLDPVSLLLNKELYQNILSYYVLYKAPYGVKPLRNIFDKVDRFVRNYDGTKYLTSFFSGNLCEHFQ